MLEGQILHAYPVRMSLHRDAASSAPWQIATQSTGYPRVQWHAQGRRMLQEKFESPNRVCMAILGSGEGSIGVETRQMNAGSIILTQDNKIAFIRKVYETEDGTSYQLDLPAGGPLSVDETSLDSVRINEVDREEVVIECDGKLIASSKAVVNESEHKNAIWANYVQARGAGLDPFPHLIHLVESQDKSLQYLLYTNPDIDTLTPELSRFAHDRKACVEVQNTKGERNVSNGAIVAHPEGFDLLDIRRFPEGVALWDIRSYDLETIHDGAPRALNRSLVWLSVDELADLSQGMVIKADMTGPEGYSVFTVDPRKIGFKSLGGTFVDTLLNYRTKR